MSNRFLNQLAAPSVIVLDDDEQALQWLRMVLSSHGTTKYHMAADFHTFIDLLRLHDVDVASIDWQLDDVDKGPEIIAYLRREHPEVAIVLYTIHANRLDAAMALGADIALVKRPDDEEAYWQAVADGARLGLARKTAKRLRALGEADLPELKPGTVLDDATEGRLYASALRLFSSDPYGGALKAYEAMMPLYTDFTRHVADLIEKILAAKGIRHHAIQQRTKDLTSFQNKLKRKGNKYGDPLKDVTDFSGVRVVAYYLRDVERIRQVLADEFAIDHEHSVDKSTELPTTSFGYRSLHLVVSIDSRRAALVEWQRFGGLKCEIQIRTVLEHLWAAVSHELQYKHEADILPVFMRRMARLSGLLELSDEEFGDLRREMEMFQAAKAQSSGADMD